MEPVLKGVVFFVLVTKMLFRGRKVLKLAINLSCTFDSPGLKTEEKRSRNRQVLCSLGEMPN